MKMIAWENKIIVALIISVKISLLQFLISFIILFSYRVQIQVKDQLGLIKKQKIIIHSKTFL